MFYLLKGLIIGVLIAAPVGPIGLLCIRRTLTHGRLAGILSGLGAATADGFYGLIAGFGLTAISSVLLKGEALLGFVGGIFLCYLGIKTYLAKPVEHAAHAKDRSNLQNYLSTFGLTITNPATIMSFLGIFAGLGVSGSYVDSSLLVLGVFLGSTIWWVTLAFAMSLVRHKMSPRIMVGIDKASGVLILLFGLVSLVKALL